MVEQKSLGKLIKHQAVRPFRQVSCWKSSWITPLFRGGGKGWVVSNWKTDLSLRQEIWDMKQSRFWEDSQVYSSLSPINQFGGRQHMLTNPSTLDNFQRFVLSNLTSDGSTQLPKRRRKRWSEWSQIWPKMSRLSDDSHVFREGRVCRIISSLVEISH